MKIVEKLAEKGWGNFAPGGVLKGLEKSQTSEKKLAITEKMWYYHGV